MGKKTVSLIKWRSEDWTTAQKNETRPFSYIPYKNKFKMN